MTLAITPKATTNKLIIEIEAFISSTGNNTAVILALFQDATADALAAGIYYPEVTSSTTANGLKLKHTMTAGTTSATTFKFRCGPSGAYTVTFNGEAAGRLMGGVMASSITITEYKA